MHSTPENDDPVLKIPIASAFLGVSVATYYRGAKAGRYPRPFKIGLRASGVSRSKLIKCRERMEAASQEQPT